VPKELTVTQVGYGQYGLFKLSTLNFSGAQASGANLDMFRSTVDNSLYSLNIRFPGSVASSVRMGNLNAESNIFSADFTFCHAVTPPHNFVQISKIYSNTMILENQDFFYFFLNNRNIVYFAGLCYTVKKEGGK